MKSGRFLIRSNWYWLVIFWVGACSSNQNAVHSTQIEDERVAMKIASALGAVQLADPLFLKGVQIQVVPERVDMDQFIKYLTWDSPEPASELFARKASTLDREAAEELFHVAYSAGATSEQLSECVASKVNDILSGERDPDVVAEYRLVSAAVTAPVRNNGVELVLVELIKYPRGGTYYAVVLTEENGHIEPLEVPLLLRMAF